MALGAIDVPVDGQLVAREGFLVEGFGIDEAGRPFRRVSVRVRDVEIGSSTMHYYRPDVMAALPHLADVACGYKVFVALPTDASTHATLTVVGEFAEGKQWTLEVAVVAGPVRYAEGPYGTLVDPNVDTVYHRDHIYGVGPPSRIPSEECVALLKTVLLPGDDVIDVGCGVGAYARPLLDSGISWYGCEINPAFVADMLARDLPVVQVEGPQLPFADGRFETAMCIEVLEHIADYERFLLELKRVSRRRAIFSVPNAEAIPILADRLIVPWHLLEADHKNFFTRSSLGATLRQYFTHVEVLPYGVMPIASSNGTQVYYHLLAIAEHGK